MRLICSLGMLGSVLATVSCPAKSLNSEIYSPELLEQSSSFVINQFTSLVACQFYFSVASTAILDANLDWYIQI